MMDDGIGNYQRARQVVIGAGNEGQRIDNYLRTCLKGVPKSRIYRILRRGEVRVNKGRIRHDYRLQLGDVIRIPPLRCPQKTPPPVPGSHVFERIQGAIIHEDNSLLVLDKPAGMAVHGGSGMSFGVIEALRAMRPAAHFLELVHRLDRDTSGCLVVAKKRSALRRMHAMLRNKDMEKSYLALVKGTWNIDLRRVDVPLRKNLLRSGERVVRVVADGKQAITEFDSISVGERASLIQANLVTGRTHQIRVHTSHIGYPIAGDEKYGDDTFNRWMRGEELRRLFLHAWKLAFNHPDTEEKVYLQAPLGEDLHRVVERLGLSIPN